MSPLLIALSTLTTSQNGHTALDEAKVEGKNKAMIKLLEDEAAERAKRREDAFAAWVGRHTAPPSARPPLAFAGSGRPSFSAVAPLAYVVPSSHTTP